MSMKNNGLVRKPNSKAQSDGIGRGSTVHSLAEDVGCKCCDIKAMGASAFPIPSEAGILVTFAVDEDQSPAEKSLKSIYCIQEN